MPHASSAPSEAGIPLAHGLYLGGIIIIVVLLIGGAGLAVFGAANDQPFLAILGPLALVMFSLFAVYPIMFGAFRLQAERRMRAVAALHPNAYLLHVVMRPKIAGQFKAAAAALGQPAKSVPWNNYAVFVADQQSLGIYGGAGTLRVSLPTASLVQATYQPVTIGVRTLTEFLLGFADASGQVWTIELLPVRWPGVVMRSMAHDDFAAEFAAMQAATHPGS